MKAWIKNLLVLQTADLRTKRMNSRLREIPKEKLELANSLSGETDKVAKAKEELLAAEKEIKKIDTKIDDVKARIKTFQGKTAMVKKNDEYKALLSEIETCKVTIGGFENKQIELMDKLDEAKKVLVAAQKSFEYMSNEADENIEELDELALGLKAEIDEMLVARKALIKKIDPELFPLYSRLINKPGEPLTRIHNNTCGNCHLKLTPQTLNDAKKGMISTCDTCGHLIYFAHE
jgi:uncharacterized protein